MTYPASYTVDLTHNPLGWEWTVKRNHKIIGQVPWLLSLCFRTRADALQAAAVFIQHDKERHHQELPV